LRGLIRWSGDGEATVAAVDGINVTVRSTRPFPPGAPAQGTLDEAHAFTLKVAGSRKESDAFVVRGRLVSATVAVREAFARAVATGVNPS
jgi:hypothetical protein